MTEVIKDYQCQPLHFTEFALSLGTEFVVVEDSSCLDTNAIILKGTTVLTYKPRLLDRPFSGSLAGIEVISHTAVALVHGQTLLLRLLVFIRILLIIVSSRLLNR